MKTVEITDNSFSRQFEARVDGHLARIEYAAHDRKVFLTKLDIPKEITEADFKENFISTVLDHIQEQKLSVMPTSRQIARFISQHREYRHMLPVGIRIPTVVVEEPESV